MTSRLRTVFGAIVWLGLAVPAARASGQAAPRPVTRAAAVEAALANGARLGVARADSALAAAQLTTAGARPNPTLSADYSKSAPQYHATVDLPVELPGVRGNRVGAARLGQLGARYRFLYERASVALEADTAYTRALAARAHAQLSARNARDADSLQRMAVKRRDAGDASELDVQLSIVNAGQAANAAATDSLTLMSTILDLQSVMGLGGAELLVMPSDSLGEPPVSDSALLATVTDSATLPVAAAEAALRSAELATRVQRRSVIESPSVMAGIETGDPRGDEPGILPTFGLSIPLPLLNHNQGPIAEAVAEESRARAELALARVESRTEVARARRELAIALVKVARDRGLVQAAERVAAMSLTAYREGAASLPSVLEAQRNSRDVLGAWVDDLADAWIAVAELRVLTLTPASPSLAVPATPSR